MTPSGSMPRHLVHHPQLWEGSGGQRGKVHLIRRDRQGGEAARKVMSKLHCSRRLSKVCIGKMLVGH